MNINQMFRRFQFKQLDQPNRIVMAPITRKFSPDGIPDAQVAEYYRRRAEGGVGRLSPKGQRLAVPQRPKHLNSKFSRTSQSRRMGEGRVGSSRSRRQHRASTVGLSGMDFLEQLRGLSTGAPVGTLEDLAHRMDAGEFDLITVGRALISDPQWPNKVREGPLDKLLPFEKEQLSSLA